MIRNHTYVGIIAAASFVAGAFLASPDLRAYAAATITSADIVDGTIRSVDIGGGEVKTSDIGGGAVTSIKIKDGSIIGADINQGFVKHKVLNDDAVGHAAGWDPNDSTYAFTIADNAVNVATSTIIINIEQNTITPCSAGFYLTRVDVFTITCETDKLGPANGAKLHYTIINTP